MTTRDIISAVSRPILATLAATLLVCVVASCDKNLAAGYDTPDPDEEAMKALESGHPDKAITILNDAYSGNKDSNRYRSLMSMALMQKHGIDIIDLALKMGESEEGESASMFTTLFGVLPDATAAGLSGLSDAIELLQAITTNPRADSDTFKLMIAQVAWFGLRMKLMDIDGDGELSAAEVMADADAVTDILDMLAQAAATEVENSAGQAAAASLTALSTSISGQTGTTDGEKLARAMGLTPSP